MNQKKSLRICLVASSGGHMSQLLALKDSWQGHDTFYVTSTPLLKNKLEKLGKVYIVGECNQQTPLKVIMVLLRCTIIAWRLKPDVVISTGAAPGALMCLLCKLFGAKVVWVDSIANVERLSLSGKIIRPFADLCLTQWQQIAKRDSKVEFAGTIL